MSPYGSESYSNIRGLRCPVCYGRTDVVIKRNPNILVYASCEDNDCMFTERQRKDLTRKAIEKMEEKDHG